MKIHWQGPYSLEISWHMLASPFIGNMMARSLYFGNILTRCCNVNVPHFVCIHVKVTAELLKQSTNKNDFR